VLEVPQPTSRHPDGAQHRGRSRLDPRRGLLRLLAALLGLAFVVGLRMFALATYTIPSESMTHTLEVGDRIVVDTASLRLRGPAALRRGDVVVFDGNGSFDPVGTHRDYVKRIIGLPGDVVACCDRDGNVSVNGTALREPYVNNPDGAPFGPLLIPPGRVFVLGDHRSDSFDSRYRGTVPIASIHGRAIVVEWPLNRVQLIGRDDSLR
jgi:signal peptidase I